ncbi:TetR/AcrR family transcriptional regulator [Haematobacter sp.]|uniref:TetR/AcrR family transcriptional regulator n=1 Tax=Haematobacter sp. TaxID=2953762 RepID=UPI0028B085DC|nr:TetR/AcrR family transcriptional regulator [Haematobacter sp.]
MDMQAETRHRLIKAAAELIAAQGLAATSIRGTCEAAGYSQGAFYSNFATKDDLLIALVEDHMAALVSSMDDILTNGQGLTLRESLQLMMPRLAALARAPMPSLVVVELNLHARRDADFAARFRTVHSAYHREFARIARVLTERHALSPQVPPEQIAWAMTSLWSGAITQAAFGEPMPLEEMMARLFEALSGSPDSSMGNG